LKMAKRKRKGLWIDGFYYVKDDEATYIGDDGDREYNYDIWLDGEWTEFSIEAEYYKEIWDYERNKPRGYVWKIHHSVGWETDEYQSNDNNINHLIKNTVHPFFKNKLITDGINLFQESIENAKEEIKIKKYVIDECVEGLAMIKKIIAYVDPMEDVDG